MSYLESIGENAVAAGKILSLKSADKKNAALLAIARAIETSADKIIKSNRIDVENAMKSGISGAFIDRLTLDEKRIKSMTQSLIDASGLEDPIGELLETIIRPNGLIINKIRVPLGVIGIIYEARPNVTSDAAGLCLKTGNPVILRGGSRALNSNIAVADVMRNALDEIGFPKDCIQLVEDTDRKTAVEMMRLNKYISVLIPRGGASLINEVVNNATVPVIKTGVGICHVYVDCEADFQKAVAITVNAKTTKPSVCNSAEVLLVHEEVYREFLPLVYKGLKEFNVEIRGDKKTCEVLTDAVAAGEKDFDTEFLDYIMAVKVVSGVDEAIDHINTHGTRHSEAIVSENKESADKFTNRVDASAVYVNASTRFTDGGEFGMGAEIGISTQMLHARGPMGLKELTSYKYIIQGNGQIR
ncbi:MAG: glutamate-5-semialdehyde dehydrogenase [Clostridiales bacterium]|nr:glutamate-5-semialdehyde dehydrogenase [Clostridiales bacterium]